MDIDLAAAYGRRFEFVAYRNQRGPWDYPTLTIRWQSDRGNGHVQAHKILIGQALADIYINAYESRVVWATAEAVRQAVRQTRWGCGHAAPMAGGNGQQFLVLCDNCCVLTTTNRDGSAQRGSGGNGDRRAQATPAGKGISE